MKSLLLVTCTIIITMLLLKNKNLKFMLIPNKRHQKITNEHLHEHLLTISNELAEIKKIIIEERDNVSQRSLTKLKLIARQLTDMAK